MAVSDRERVYALCDEKFRAVKELKKHHEESHDDLELKREINVFNTDDGFEKEELRTKSLFVKNGGIRKKAKNRQFTYYICNRCGIANLKLEEKRHEKTGESVKCGKKCPAIREQKEESIKITVEYRGGLR
ncbi:hypothetical protein TNCT_180831 [Trichonephila clavata]|uniref:C2H2-type domain-containing protein n=1 Tax=Trichonephila clavata TaxID=2740835 RepID=A0A8X6HS81_TRICU|nr:hypothetical protein TNCT_180831 [Trichonephila clavata]